MTPDQPTATATPRQIITDQINRHVSMTQQHRAWLADDISTRIEAELSSAQAALADRTQVIAGLYVRIDKSEAALAEAKAEVARLKEELREAQDDAARKEGA